MSRHTSNPHVARLVGSLIKMHRRRAGLSMARLSALILASPCTVHRYESGKNSPSVDSLFRLAHVLGCEPSDLLPDLEMVKGEGGLVGAFTPEEIAREVAA